MPLQIEMNEVLLPKDFKWGEEWRAVRIWKEERDEGDRLYAYCIRYYGPNDYGNKKSEEVYIGREVQWIRGKDWDRDPRSKTFGERVTVDAETVLESIWDDKKGKYVEVTSPANAEKTYAYKHDANDPEIIAQYKTLVGKLKSGRTKLYFVYNNGDRVVNMDNPEDFWTHSVKELIRIETTKDSIFTSDSEKRKTGVDREHNVQESPQPPRNIKTTKSTSPASV